MKYKKKDEEMPYKKNDEDEMPYKKDEEEMPYNMKDAARETKGSGEMEEDSSVQPPPGMSSFPSPYLGLPFITGSPSADGELNSDIMDKEQGKEMIDQMILKLQKMNSFLEGVVTYWDDWAARGGEKTTADGDDEKYLEKTEVESEKEKKSSSEYNEPSDKKDGKDDDEEMPYKNHEEMPYKKNDEDEEMPYKKNDEEEMPYKKNDEEEMPYKKKNEDEEMPYKKNDEEEMPYKKNE